MPYSSIRRSASFTSASLFSVTGSIIMPFSARFTLRTSFAWRSMLIFLCSTPMPPSWAMPMAIAASVTVSIAADTKGVFNMIFFEKRDATVTSLGSTSE